MTTTELRVLASIAKNPDAPDYQIAKNLGLRVSEVAAARQHPAGKADAAPAKNPVTMKSGGVELTGLRVLPRKPADSAAGYIKRLPTGRGYEPRVLAAEWGISEETIRRHAKDLKCLKFVEVNDEWVPMVMHPDTASRYHA
jgi:DNA-binding CsgD family transcriptional regulator